MISTTLCIERPSYVPGFFTASGGFGVLFAALGAPESVVLAVVFHGSDHRKRKTSKIALRVFVGA